MGLPESKAPAASVPACSDARPGISDVPDELLQRVVRCLDLSNAWRLRLVDTRWRSIVERAAEAWDGPLTLIASTAAGPRAAARLAAAGRLQPTDVRIALRSSGTAPASAHRAVRRQELNFEELLDAACGVLAACGPALRAATIDGGGCEGGGISWEHVAPLLRALQAAPQLQSLALVGGRSDRQVPPAADLAAVLAPLGRLASLSLPRHLALDRAAAAALAAALPSLSTLRAAFDSGEALAGLPSLRELETGPMELFMADQALAALASTPGAPTLTRLSLGGPSRLLQGSSAVLRSLSRLTALERLNRLAIFDMEYPGRLASQGDIAGLGRLARLKEIQVFLLLRAGGEPGRAALRGLSEAARAWAAGPAPPLDLEIVLGHAASGEELADLIAACSPLLRDVGLRGVTGSAPLPRGLPEALCRCPALRKVGLRVSAEGERPLSALAGVRCASLALDGALEAPPPAAAAAEAALRAALPPSASLRLTGRLPDSEPEPS